MLRNANGAAKIHPLSPHVPKTQSCSFAIAKAAGHFGYAAVIGKPFQIPVAQTTYLLGNRTPNVIFSHTLITLPLSYLPKERRNRTSDPSGLATKRST